MLKKLIFTGFLCAFALLATAQDLETIPPGIVDTLDTPFDVKQNYDLLLSRRDIKYDDNFSDESVLFNDSVYIKRLHALPTSMELSFNPAVKAQIELYATKRKRQVSYMLGEGMYYFPMFEEALDKEGLPLELKYLPVIESAMNPIARSRVGATGLWQFMAGTGKMYDLEINSLVDERRDPVKSTEAAAKYLKYLYSIYKDWNLVIAAYNCGPGNVIKAIRRSGGQTDYWAIYPYLPKETRGYVPIFIAATYIMNYYQEHNITPAEVSKPLSMDSIVINKNLHFQQIADVINVPIEDLRQYNPQFKSDIVPGSYKGYSLNLPMQKIADFIQHKDTIYAHRANELMAHRKVAGVDVVTGGKGASSGSAIAYRVKKGDTLTKLASQYGVTSTQIKQWNGLSSNKLTVGRRLNIYRSENLAQADVRGAGVDEDLSSDTTVVSISGLTKTVSVPKTTTTYYKVRKGDNWTSVAKKNKVTVDNLRAWNKDVKAKGLIAGKSLKIQKTEYVEIQEAIVLPEPEMPIVIIDSTYTAELIGGYLKKIEKDASSLPRIRISSATDSDDEERSNKDDSKIIYHKVKIGETITQIAARYNVSKEDIVVWNKLKSNMAKVGQRLLILLPDDESSDINEANTRSVAVPLTATK